MQGRGSGGGTAWLKKSFYSSLRKTPSWLQDKSDIPHTPASWKPVTLQFPFLMTFGIASLALIVALELCYFRSSRNNNENGGGVAFATSGDDLPALAVFSYLYLPTILAAIYSITWSWVDLDVKRLEPWFQLSRPSGATAENSMLLYYPSEFLAFVPIKALRRRHWAVFTAGITTVMIFWVITPLQSAIFTTGTVTRSRQASMATTGSLLPLGAQTSGLSTNFLNTAYAISWLNQSLPPYTTADYALKPFAPIDVSLSTSPTQSWSTSTLAYSTKLNCQPAIVDCKYYCNSATCGLGVCSFDNGNGCLLQQVDLSFLKGSEQWALQYIQYWDNAHDDWSLQNPNCSQKNSHNFLAIWAPQNDSLKAQFCEPTYYVQNVSAEVNGTDLSVIKTSFDPKMPTESTKILSDADFNITHFEYIIGTGATPLEHVQRYNFEDLQVLEQYPRLQKYNLSWPSTNMVGFGVAANPKPLADLSDPLVLQQAFDKAHKLLFSSAVHTLTNFSDTRGGSEARIGIIFDRPMAIVLVRPFSIAVEAALLIVTSLCLGLWYYSSRRPSMLVADMASIADIMSLARNSKGVSSLFTDDGRVTQKTQEAQLLGKRFVLSIPGGSEQLALHTISGDQAINVKEEHVNKLNLAQRSSQYVNEIRPLELRLGVGFSLITSIMASLCLLAVLFVRAVRYNGLGRPSSDPIILSFLENALPTAFASVLEPLWVVLNRLLCLLRPFEELRLGNAQPSSTLRVRYTSLPPQLIIWPALLSRHFILAAVSIVALSSNALALVSSVMFNEAATNFQYDITSTQNLSSTFNGSASFLLGRGGLRIPITFRDHLYTVRADLQGGISLPPWIDSKYYYLPFEIPSDDPQFISSSHGSPQVQRYSAVTRGFGLATTCQPLLTTEVSNNTVLQPIVNGSSFEFFTEKTLPDGRKIPCKHSWSHASRAEDLGLLPNSSTSLELTPTEVSTTEVEGDTGSCGKPQIFGWARVGSMEFRDEHSIDNATNGRSFESGFVSCTADLATAEFRVSVDARGHILDAEQTSPFDNNIASFSSTNSTGELVGGIFDLIFPTPGTADNHWHNDSFTATWIGSLLNYYRKSTELTDPLSPLPNMNQVSLDVETVEKRLCAAILGLNSWLFYPAPDNSTITVTVTVIETRIFISKTAFAISSAILALHLVMAIIFYAKRPQRSLPRMPDTIASLLAYVSMSHAVDNLAGRPPDDGHNEKHYGYGRFIGVDGKPHVGINEQERIIPLRSKNPTIRNRRGWQWNVQAWLQDRKQPQTWI